MLDPVGELAVNSLASDVGVLTKRLAIQAAVLQVLVEQASLIDVSKWENQTVHDPDAQSEATVYVSHVPGDQVDLVHQLLSTILSLR